MTVDDVNCALERAEKVRPDFEGCPIEPLGHLRGVYYFATRCGELAEIPGRSMTDNAIATAFDGNTEWLGRRFPGNKNEPFDRKDARDWLMRKCAEVGFFDTNMAIRELGVWRPADPDMRGLIVHTGREVWRLVDGEREIWQPGLAVDGALYIGGSAMAVPAEVAATVADGERLLRLISNWNFARSVDPELVVGFTGQAMLGGAATWRAHEFVHGPKGSGKTWLADAVSATLGAAAHPIATDFTKAGFEQSFQRQARAVVLDEAERSAGAKPGEPGRVEMAVELLRHMSAGSGAHVVRGSASGEARSLTVTGAAFLSAISPPPFTPQDRSRFTLIRLRPLPTGAEAADRAADIAEEIRAMARLSAAFRRRALDHYERYLADFETWRRAIMTRDLEAREADQVAALMAGRDLLLEDQPRTAEAAAQALDRAYSVLLEATVAEDGESEGELALNHLLTAPADTMRGSDHRRISDLMLEARSGDKIADGEAKQLEAFGLKFATHNGVQYLLVANQHHELRRLYANTRWANGGWTRALEQLPGVEPWFTISRRGASYFGGVRVRAMALPAEYFPSNDDEGESAQEPDDGIPF